MLDQPTTTRKLEIKQQQHDQTTSEGGGGRRGGAAAERAVLSKDESIPRKSISFFDLN